MYAAVLHSLGSSPRYAEFPEPVAGDGEALVHVRASAIKPIDRMIAAGTHYLRPDALPTGCGLDGVGTLDDGSRVIFLAPRAPYGALAERTVVPRAYCIPIPDAVSDVQAAAIFNPGMSALNTLHWRAKLQPGESVLVLGATGATGRLAVQLARLHGAGRIVAAGRNERVLASLGADAVIQLDRPRDSLVEAFARAGHFDVVVDYLWGAPTEALLTALTRHDLQASAAETRLVEVGESAGATIALPGAVLRSTRLTILGHGTGTAPPRETMAATYMELMRRLVAGEIGVETETVPLADVERAWPRAGSERRTVVVM